MGCSYFELGSRDKIAVSNRFPFWPCGMGDEFAEAV
jgi:hypothetical protein